MKTPPKIPPMLKPRSVATAGTVDVVAIVSDLYTPEGTFQGQFSRSLVETLFPCPEFYSSEGMFAEEFSRA